MCDNNTTMTSHLSEEEEKGFILQRKPSALRSCSVLRLIYDRTPATIRYRHKATRIIESFWKWCNSFLWAHWHWSYHSHDSIKPFERFLHPCCALSSQRTEAILQLADIVMADILFRVKLQTTETLYSDNPLERSWTWCWFWARFTTSGRVFLKLVLPLKADYSSIEAVPRRHYI